MPELPETETIARDLDREIRGRRITEVVVDEVRRAAREHAGRARGARDGRAIERAWRRAKLVVLDLDSGDRIVVQPRFTGALLLARGPLPDAEAPYSTLHFALDDGRDLHYRDIRRLGTVALMTPARFAEYSATLGIEPLDPAFTESHLSGILRGSRQAVKKVLMDQRVVVGIGNIYANEACWRAGVDPSRARAHASRADEAAALHAGIVGVLDRVHRRARHLLPRLSRRLGRQAATSSARSPSYGRGGEPCLRCGARLVETHAIDGRTTVLCARCQR